jgi:hypothetical protein
MMRLKLIAFRDGSVEVTGVFVAPLEVGASCSRKTEDSWSQYLLKKPISLVLNFRNA